MHNARHELHDTRHRVVRYRFRAATRFREYFAPAITSAREGSHAPVISRNDRTLPGFAIPARINPEPKINPDTNAMMLAIFDFPRVLYLKNVSNGIDSDKARAHKKQGCNDGAGRQAR